MPWAFLDLERLHSWLPHDEAASAAFTNKLGPVDFDVDFDVDFAAMAESAALVDFPDDLEDDLVPTAVPTHGGRLGGKAEAATLGKSTLRFG